MAYDTQRERVDVLSGGVNGEPLRVNRAPEKTPEIPGALQHLDDQLGKLQELSKQLEQRLLSVLRASPPDGKACGPFIAGTPHGQILRECASRAGTVAGILADILDRLEL